jgi:hypothetical protein
VLQEIEMTKRRLIIIPLTATPAELRHIASCIDVGNEEHEDAFEYNQADALSSKLNEIADTIEGAETEGMDLPGFMFPFIQDGVVQGAADRETVASGAPTS